MSYREILRILSSYLYLYAGILAVPLLLAAYYQFRIELNTHPQIHTTAAFAYTIVICLALAWLCAKGAGKGRSLAYQQHEAIASVVIIWFLTPAIGALPFLLSGTLDRFDQAYFEATSGFTTTGATILEAKRYDSQTGKEIPIQRTINDGIQETTYRFYGTVKPVRDPQTGQLLEGLEAVSPALLFWRSLMQWIGGMGIIVLFVAFLPELGVKGKFLFQTEAPGPLKEGFKPRIKETALQLWKIYVGLTLLEILFLIVVNPKMSLFDAITLAFSTLSTGGFSVHNENIAYYQQTATEWVILLFMILGSLNFSIYYSLLKGKFYRLFDAELICFLCLLGILGFFVAWHLKGGLIVSLTGEVAGTYSFCDALRIGFFQLVSTQTSTGFFIANYDTWPYVVQVVLLIAMYLGGMSGSTAGGLKVIRIQILFKVVKNKIESIFQPQAIKINRVGDKEIDSATASSVLCFFFIATAVSVLGTFLYVWDQIDFETALGLTPCMINNTGIGFRLAGASGTMAFLSPFSSFLSSFLMILGRLEYYALLALLFPAFWENR
jgi:trk system potassium uptake protein TrkH